MKTLWAPWRMTYIREQTKNGCLFCQISVEKRDEENLILYGGEYTFVVMNRFPYNNGHLMIVPRRHCADVESLETQEIEELFHLLKLSIRVLATSLAPDGYNVGINLGKAAGAGMEHLHIHVVPRWSGDSNFMPVLSDTKVIPEFVETTCRKLRLAFQEVLGRTGGGRKT
jgi:ATP adenylyltransferase